MLSQRVLELGAGLGLVSMTASLLGAHEVVMTDGEKTVLECAKHNLAENSLRYCDHVHIFAVAFCRLSYAYYPTQGTSALVGTPPRCSRFSASRGPPLGVFILAWNHCHKNFACIHVHMHPLVRQYVIVTVSAHVCLLCPSQFLAHVRVCSVKILLHGIVVDAS